MNKALDLYFEEEDVISIHGYNYPVILSNLVKTFFLKGADCWGWATWKRGWSLFEQSGLDLLNKIKEEDISLQFNFNDSYPYAQMLEDQINGKNDSWAIRWYASAFLNNKYTLYPARSLVRNIGLDSSGTHSGEDFYFNIEQIDCETFEILEKVEINEDISIKLAIEHFLKVNEGGRNNETDANKENYFWLTFMNRAKYYVSKAIKEFKK
jgi:hypothetical protein